MLRGSEADAATMTHKSHPTINRIPLTKDWKSRWLDTKHYKEHAEQDYIIRNYIHKNYRNAGIQDIQIERFSNSLSVIIYTSRPGIIIGRGGSGIEDLRSKLIKKLTKVAKKKNWENTYLPELRLEVREIRETDSHARLVAFNIAEQLERRMPFRRVIKRAMDRVMSNKEIKGAKILVKGRLNGAEMARKEFLKEGNLPLQKFRADIDYAHVGAVTKYGVIGVKVWIYKGEKLE